MGELKEIQRETGLPVQSHLSENPGEVQWVRELCPEAESYGDAYVRAGLFGDDCPAIMAHCIWVTEAEMEQMRKRGVYAAHCPSPMRIFPPALRRCAGFCRRGFPQDWEVTLRPAAVCLFCGLWRMRYRCRSCGGGLWIREKRLLPWKKLFIWERWEAALSLEKWAALLDGYEFDAVVFDDGDLPHPQKLDVKSRLERLISLADDRQVVHKYVRGTELF